MRRENDNTKLGMSKYYQQNLQYMSTTTADQDGRGIIFLLINLIIKIILFPITLFKMITRRKINDAEYDRRVNEIITESKRRALSALGLDISEVSMVEPVVALGPSYDENLLTDFYFKEGRDSINRFSKYSLTIYFFGKDQIFIYNYVFSMLMKEFKEETKEIAYKDVVSVTTERMLAQRSVKSNVYYDFEVEGFSLTAKDGRAVKSFVNTGIGSIMNSLNAMKNLIRDKKKDN